MGCATVTKQVVKQFKHSFLQGVFVLTPSSVVWLHVSQWFGFSGSYRFAGPQKRVTKLSNQFFRFRVVALLLSKPYHYDVGR